MTRSQALAELRNTLNSHGLLAAHKQAVQITETMTESAEELLADALRNILLDLHNTSSLFQEN